MAREFNLHLGTDLGKTKLGYYIDTVARIETGLFNEGLSEIGITFSQFRVLNWLWRYGEMTQKELHQYAQIQPSSLSTLLNVLIDKGMVERKHDPDDARVRKICLTDASRAIEEKAWEIVRGFDESIRQILSEEEYQTTLDCLKRLAEALPGE